jgi:hypothetical protein
MKKLLINWKTSLSGLGSIILGIASITTGNMNEGIGAIVSGIGLILAKDHNK